MRNKGKARGWWPEVRLDRGTATAKGVAEEGGQEGPAGDVRTHTRAIEGASVCIIPVCIPIEGPD